YVLEYEGAADRESRAIHVVSSKVYQQIGEDEDCVSRRRVHLAVNSDNKSFLLCVRIEGANGRTFDEWGESMLACIEKGKSQWVRISSGESEYRCKTAPWETFPGPIFPPDIKTVPEMLKLAFKNRQIKSIVHPLLRQLRAEGK